MILKSSDQRHRLVVLSNVLTISKDEGLDIRAAYKSDKIAYVPAIGFSMIGKDCVYSWLYENTDEGRKMRDEDFERISNK